MVTPLPLQQGLVERSGAGAVVPFGAVDEVVAVLTSWAADPGMVRDLGRRGHRHVAEHHDWQRLQADFLAALEGVADRGR